VWVTFRGAASLSVGLDSPSGTWIAPVAPGDSGGKSGDGVNASVLNGSGVSGSPVPQGSNGAIVVWNGSGKDGAYAGTLEATGTADLYVQGTGDAEVPPLKSVHFEAGVREGTINIPATHPAIIAVGCTINRPQWMSIDHGDVGLRVPAVDAAGGIPQKGVYHE